MKLLCNVCHQNKLYLYILSFQTYTLTGVFDASLDLLASLMQSDLKISSTPHLTGVPVAVWQIVCNICMQLESLCPIFDNSNKTMS